MTERLTEIKYNGIVSRKKEETGISCSTYCDSCSHGGGNCKYVGEMVKKLAEYETAEEKGRLVVLPCKAGDYVWSNDYGRPCAFKVTEITIAEDGVCIMVADDEQCSSASSYSFDDFGKVLFLTREEAEKALEGMKE